MDRTTGLHSSLAGLESTAVMLILVASSATVMPSAFGRLLRCTPSTALGQTGRSLQAGHSNSAATQDPLLATESQSVTRRSSLEYSTYTRERPDCLMRALHSCESPPDGIEAASQHVACRKRVSSLGKGKKGGGGYTL
jgi:hypothetical protein